MNTDNLDTNSNVFFALIKAGLWADLDTTDLRNKEFVGSVDWDMVYRLAEEQSVLGLLLAGVERFKAQDNSFLIPQEVLLQWIGEIQVLEQQNLAMNKFIATLVEKMRVAGIYVVLVKGQGVAQCYESPLWRACGDVDFLLSDSNYTKAKEYLIPLADSVDSEGKYMKHLSMVIDSWIVELHGDLHSGLSTRLNNVIDEVQKDVFYGGNVRSWMNGSTQVFLPGANCDVLFVFSHFVKHFYVGGIGLRQICDWCRLLWKYHANINMAKLEQRLNRMNLMVEWKAFGSFVVDYLGMPVEIMPFYTDSNFYKKKARSICKIIMKTGNFGQNEDMSYRSRYPNWCGKFITLGRRFKDFINLAMVFPINSLLFFVSYTYHRAFKA